MAQNYPMNPKLRPSDQMLLPRAARSSLWIATLRRFDESPHHPLSPVRRSSTQLQAVSSPYPQGQPTQ
uniref:Uncharacterized protein n=1 Tax=Manihot esculenta TaxID=3983 RepID=A0A2C9VL79_MANES